MDSAKVKDPITISSPSPTEQITKEIIFHADHTFAFIIGEETSGTILFEGVVMRP